MATESIDLGNPDAVLAATQADLFWLPPDVSLVDRPELLVMSCPRPIVGLNSVQRTRGDAGQVQVLVNEVSALHAGRPSRWSVSPMEPVAALEQALFPGGWEPIVDHFGYSIASASVATPHLPHIEVKAVADRQGLLDWHRVIESAFGKARAATEADLRQDLAACTVPGARVHRVVSYDRASGQPLAAGGLTLFPALRFGFLWAGGCVPEGRGRGAYRAVVAARAAHAASVGAERIGLYARVDTSAPIVARLGFDRHGPMAFWERDASHPGCHEVSQTKAHKR